MSPVENEDKITKVLNAWTTLRTEKSFAGMTLEQFTAKIQPSLTARDTLAKAVQTIKVTTVERDQADVAAMPVVQRVVAAVVADETEGDDGELYEQMGYKRRSERASGLHRNGGVKAASKSAAAS
jgi:hypothetical protein